MTPIARLPIHQPDRPDPLRIEAEAQARAALDSAVEALRGVYPDDWPALVVYLLRILDPLGLDLEAVRREVDDRLAWGDWRQK